MSLQRTPPQEVVLVNNESTTNAPGTSAARMPLHRDAEEASVNATKLIKLPPFWRENPILWFAQVEAGFALSRITSDESKFRYVILNLDSNILPFIADIVASPPERNKYDTVKARIVSSFDESSESKLRRLLQGLDLGEEKPSHCLQRLRNLAAGQCSDSVLRTLFLERLPDPVRGILAANDTADLAQLALQADKIMDYTKGAPRINVVNLPPAQPEHSTEIAELHRRIEELTRQVRENHTPDRQTRRRSRSRPRFRGRSAPRQPKTAICYYHSKFGGDARKCRPPCTWPGTPPPSGN